MRLQAIVSVLRPYVSGRELYLGLAGAWGLPCTRVDPHGDLCLLPHPCVSERPLAEAHVGLATFALPLYQAAL